MGKPKKTEISICGIKKKKITIEMKLDVLKRYHKGEKLAFIEKTLNLAPSTVRTICERDAEKIKAAANASSSSGCKTLTRIRNPLLMKMELLLTNWIEIQTQRKMPLSQNILQAKAKSLYQDLAKKLPGNENASTSDVSNFEMFEASRGWFQRFKARANLHNISLKGESGSADFVGAERFKDELKVLISDGGYIAKQVFNVDETGLFWKRLPTRTFISKAEKSAQGYKACKERLTLLLGGNAHGDFKFKPLLIYHSENPRALKNISKHNLPVYWRANKKAWMTATLFDDWAKNCCIPEIEKYCTKENINFKALVLLDNAPGHPIYINELSDKVKFVFMPPNTTSLIQPMDQGVISTFKSYYLRRTFKQLLDITDSEDNVTMKAFWRSYNVANAVENIASSWNEVKPSCMNGVWKTLWPECRNKSVLGTDTEIDESYDVCQDVAELASAANFEGMEILDIEEIIYGPEEMSNEDLIELSEMAMVVNEDEEKDNVEVVAEEQLPISKKISEGLKLINRAIEIFAEVDDNHAEFSKFRREISINLQRYEEMYLHNKAVPVQTTYILLTYTTQLNFILWVLLKILKNFVCLAIYFLLKSRSDVCIFHIFMRKN